MEVRKFNGKYRSLVLGKYIKLWEFFQGLFFLYKSLFYFKKKVEKLLSLNF